MQCNSLQLDELDKQIQSAILSFSSNAVGPLNPPTNTPLAADAGVNSNNSSFASQGSEEAPTKLHPLVERQSHYGLVWIVYMRFGRQAEGLKASRPLFATVRRERWTPWQV
jgi:cleavage stimulation factor subunit 3